MKIQVRWHEFNGTTPWLDCEQVRAEGPWLIVVTDSMTGEKIMVPDHIVRGRVEVRPKPSGLAAME